MNEERKMLIASEADIYVNSIEDIRHVLDALALYRPKALLLTAEDLGPAFFDLKSGLAGELLQKFVNYHVRAAIVVPQPESYGERFKELAREHRLHRLIRFFRTREEADAWLGA